MEIRNRSVCFPYSGSGLEGVERRATNRSIDTLKFDYGNGSNQSREFFQGALCRKYYGTRRMSILNVSLGSSLLSISS